MNKTNSAALVFVCTSVMMSPGIAAEPLRYDIKPKQVVPYTVTITVETPSSVETMAGVIVYTGRKAADNDLTIEYSGGLKKSTKRTKSSGSRGPGFGPFGRRGGPPIPRSPFDRPDFRGLSTTTNTLVISRLGSIESLRGDSQLPHLLGNLSLMPFEALPAGDKTEWQDGNGVTITSGSSSSSRFGPRFGPFGNDNDEKIRTGGGEVANYKVQKDDGKLVTIARTYSLTSPAPVADETGYEMKGSGTWVFNRELGVSESMDTKMELNLKGQNTRVKFPITIAWNRMSDTDYAAHQKQLEEQKAAMLAQLAKNKAKGPAVPKPIDAFRKKHVMGQLQNGNWTAVWGMLEALNRNGPTPVVKEDMDLMTQVGVLRGHSHEKVRASAEKVWTKWKDTFEKLAADEQKAAVASAIGPVSESENPFTEDDSEDGRGVRTWADASGRFKVEAEFVKLQGAIVILKKADGKTVRVPKARLSAENQKLIDKLSK